MTPSDADKPAGSRERKRTPLWELHRQDGACLIDFGGWDMPVQYTAGTTKEHQAVRSAVGLFDVSHMGEVFFRGPRARGDRATHLERRRGRASGQSHLHVVCRPNGGVVDDCIFYKKSDEEFVVIVNASNTKKDFDWLCEHSQSSCDVIDASNETALIAVQGPKAVAVVDRLAETDLAHLPGLHFTDALVAGVACMAARTGYTGEDGFELACANADAPKLWSALLEAATPLGGLPIGLGARDTLRLESKLPLYGNDLDEDHTPLEAGLGWAVKLDGRNFIGAVALEEQRATGLSRQLVGFRISAEACAIARHNYPIIGQATGDSGEPTVIGVVSSGGPGISVEGAIGLAYVPVAYTAAGTLSRSTVVARVFQPPWSPASSTSAPERVSP